MNVQDDYLFVRFDKYCKTCKHEKLEENEPPCDECLEHPVNLFVTRVRMSKKDRSAAYTT